jgi:hypothetical protein
MESLDNMLDRAVADGYGSSTELRFRFLRFQRDGLLGNAVGKARRRGGEGLWHPTQARLFDLYLRQRGFGVRPATLANVPVGLWLLGTDGIALEQVQRAMRFWAGRTATAARPSDRRSLRSRAVAAQVDRFAAGAPGVIRRRLRHAFDLVLDELPAPSEPSLDVLREALVLGTSAGQRPSVEQRELAATAFRALRLRLLALRYLDFILSPKPGVTDAWEWCRDVVVTLHLAMTDPVTPDHLTTAETLPDIANGGCSLALQTWGMAIEGQGAAGRGGLLKALPKLELPPMRA